MPRAQRFPEQEGSMAKNEDFETSTGKGGETHQHVPKKGPHSKPDAHLTTNQGIRVSDNQNSLRAGARGLPCSKILSCGKKYSTLTTSEFRNVSCTRAVLPRTVISRISNRWPISQRPTCSSARAKRRRCSPAFRR